MTLFAATASVLVNSRAPDPLYRCELCPRCEYVRNREMHLSSAHELIAAIFGSEGAHIDVLFSEVRS